MAPGTEERPSETPNANEGTYNDAKVMVEKVMMAAGTAICKLRGGERR